jgi:hypothetical protein
MDSCWDLYLESGYNCSRLPLMIIFTAAFRGVRPHTIFIAPNRPIKYTLIERSRTTKLTHGQTLRDPGVNLTRQPAALSAASSLRRQWPSLIILLVSLLYWLPVHEARLNADTFLQRSLRTGGGLLIPGFIEKSLNGEISENKTSGEVPLTGFYRNSDQYFDGEVEVVFING